MAIVLQTGAEWMTGKIGVLAIVGCLVFLVTSYFNKGLNRFPGPVIAKFSQVWMLQDTWRGQHHQTIIQLHKKYGKIVRLGPNIVSLADPANLKVIYGFAKRLNKSQFYETFVPRGVRSNVFAERDDRVHEYMKKPLVSAYSMTSLINYEPYIDEQVKKFLSQLEEEFASPRRICEMDKWLQYYAFDVIAAITWGCDYGFMTTGQDVDHSIQCLREGIDYKATIGQMPWLEKIMTKTALGARLFGERFGSVGKVNQIIAIRRRVKSLGHTDMLQTILDLHEANPNAFPETAILGVMLANWNAGSDTTAITLRAIVYFVLRTPGVLALLKRELDSANLCVPVTWKDSQQLPYLDACIKEAMRLHPAVGFGLERVVPEEGLSLTDSTYLRGGTVVGMNAWVVHRDKDVFGADADTYNPARWLRGPQESEEVFQTRYQNMRRHDFTFGGGSRTCLGKNISLIEMYKVIPSLLITFDVQLAEPAREWQIENSWFVFQSGLNCTLKKKEKDLAV